MRSLPPSLLLLLAVITPPPGFAATRFFNFTVGRFDANLDGVTRNVIGVNGKIVEPIVVDRGDTVLVQVNNRLDAPTTLHWHGLSLKGANHFDGPAQVTQCPIAPGRSFLYNLTLGEEVGTFWWHGHYRSQYVDGLRGPLIIRDPTGPYVNDYDNELIVQLSDWYHYESEDLLKRYLSPTSNGDEPIPDSGLINGKGRYNCSLAAQRNITRNCTDHHSMETFHVRPGKRYRLRLINSAAFAAFNFSIDGHRMTVIEMDGIDVNKVVVDRLSINVGQRYSVIVDMTALPGNYWVRATIDTTIFPIPTYNLLDPDVRAILHYVNTPLRDPSTSQQAPLTKPINLDPFTLTPLIAQSVPDVTTELHISFSFDTAGRALVTAENHCVNSTYSPPRTPTLFDVLDGRQVPPSSNIIKINAGDVVQIVVVNHDNAEHPFHLHGHNFWILAASANTRYAPTTRLHLINPPHRDSTTVPPNGFTVLRFIADNPGVWLFHCHIEWHVQAGLVVTFVEDEEGVRGRGVPRWVRDVCEKGDGFVWPAYRWH